MVVGSAKGVAQSARSVAKTTKTATVATVRTTVTFGYGFWCAFRGVGLLMVRPRWWPYALLPVIMALIAFIYLLIQTFGGVHDWVSAWTLSVFGEVGGWFAALLSAIALIVAAMLLFYVAFPPFARLVAAPFMALFADKIVEGVSGRPVPQPEGSRFVRWVLRPIAEAFVLLLIRVVITLVALPLLLIPLLGQVAFAMLLFPIEAMDLLDWAQSARAVPLNRRLPFLRQNLAACAGLGAGAALFLAIPVVNVFAVPALLVGAVLLDQKLSPDFPGNPTAPPTPGSPSPPLLESDESAPHA